MYVQFKPCVFGFIVKFKHPQQGDVFIAELEDGMAYLKDILLLWSFKEMLKTLLFPVVYRSVTGKTITLLKTVNS